MNLKDRAKQLKEDIPVIFLCLKSPKTPVIAKFTAALTIIYALSPIDLIPDFIPVIGYLDDLIILPGLIALTIKLIPAELIESKRIEAKNIWENGRPKKWYFALPFIFIWILFIIFILRIFFIN